MHFRGLLIPKSHTIINTMWEMLVENKSTPLFEVAVQENHQAVLKNGLAIPSFPTFLERIQQFNPMKKNEVTVFHGCKHWNSSIDMLPPSVTYLLARGAELNKAIAYAEGLLEMLTNFHDAELLSLALYNAQVTGINSPFISVSKSREVARQFALGDSQPGYILTIKGPEGCFYDFESVRSKLNIPPRPEFTWMEELGIPLLVTTPFEIVQVDKVSGVKEDTDMLFRR